MTYSQPFPSSRSGVYRTPSDVDRLESEAQSGGHAWAEIGLGVCRTKQDALAAIADAVGAPAASFGANWDALADVLQDLSWRHAAGQTLRLRGTEALEPASERTTLLEVLQASAAYWRSRGKPFFAFVDDARELPEWR